LLYGADSAIVGPNPFAVSIPGAPAYLRAWNANTIPASRYSGSLGDWGLSARWSPAWLDGTLGFYGRNATDIAPQQWLAPGLATGLPAATCTAIGGINVAPGVCIVNKNATNVADLTTKGRFGNYNLAYATGMNIYGISLSKNLGGISFGSEISYREGMSLLSDPVTVLPNALVNPALGQVATVCGAPSKTAPGVPQCVPTDHGTPGALGNTWHGLVNALGVLPKTALFDTLSYSTELTWMMWDKVTQNEAVFKGRAGYDAIDRVSKSYFGLAINLTPTWYQVYPGVDLLAPISWSQGLVGNSAVSAGGQDGTGTWGVGLALDIYSKYRIDLKYVGFFGNYQTSPTTGAVTVQNGTLAGLVDRGFVNLTFKTTF